MVIIQKGKRHFFKIRNIVNQQKIVDLLMFTNRHFFLENEFFWYVYCLLMIVSFDTIKCGRHLFFQQEIVVVGETCEIQLFIF